MVVKTFFRFVFGGGLEGKLCLLSVSYYPGVWEEALVAFLGDEVVSVILVVAALCSVVRDQP